MIRRFSLFALFLLAACGGSSAVDAGLDLGPRTDAGPPDLGTNVAFRPGPYGSTPGSVAGPFSEATLDGTLDFAASFDGTDSWIFVIYAPGYPYGESLWTSSIDELLTAANGTHTQFVIMSFIEPDGMTDHAMDHVAEFKTRADAAIAAASPAVQTWATGRFHYVTTPANRQPEWHGYLDTTHAPVAFAIDHAQVVREVGLLADVTSPDTAHLKSLAYEAERFDFEAAREAALDAHATVVPVATSVTLTDGDLDLPVALPDSATIGSFDKLEVDIALSCLDHDQNNCTGLDHPASLVVCHDAGSTPDAGVPDAGAADGGTGDAGDAGDVDATVADAGSGDAGSDAGAPDAAMPTGTVCDEELARLVTPYGREGRWIVDASPALAFLVGGGMRTFRFNAGTADAGKPYIVDISLRMSNTRSTQHPVQAIRLWDGNAFDASYDGLYAPITFTVPTGIRKVELFATITGEGFGSESQNCAEFCDHQHHFTLNGMEHLLDFTAAGNATACIDDVLHGTVPNQVGLWQLGRGGACPGNAVVPFRVDLTDELDVHGGANTITYSATVSGGAFDPIFYPMPMPGGSRPVIDMQSWLVYWR